MRKGTPAAAIPPKVIGFAGFLSGEPAARYRLRLYVAGSNLNSTNAIKNIRQICDGILTGRCELEIIDLYQQPALARRDRVLAVPTLVKVSPSPAKSFIGDMSDLDRILAGLGLRLLQEQHVRKKQKER